ncbi:hypothetical protein HBB16_03915 [Pseudonocardia sp. MCCB 268]|nr:hypothetical protein [Pseudonocardia cytotoxica]
MRIGDTDGDWIAYRGAPSSSGSRRALLAAPARAPAGLPGLLSTRSSPTPTPRSSAGTQLTGFPRSPTACALRH